MESVGLNNFYSLVAMHQKTHSFAALTRSFFFLRIAKIVRAHFPWNNLYHRKRSRLILAQVCPAKHIQKTRNYGKNFFVPC